MVVAESRAWRKATQWSAGGAPGKPESTTGIDQKTDRGWVELDGVVRLRP